MYDLNKSDLQKRKRVIAETNIFQFSDLYELYLDIIDLNLDIIDLFHAHQHDQWYGHHGFHRSTNGRPLVECPRLPAQATYNTY